MAGWRRAGGRSVYLNVGRARGCKHSKGHAEQCWMVELAVRRKQLWTTSIEHTQGHETQVSVTALSIIISLRCVISVYSRRGKADAWNNFAVPLTLLTAKVSFRRGYEGSDAEWRYISTLSSTSMLDGVGWLASLPGRFTPRKETRYPLYRRLDGLRGWYGRVRKISLLPVFDPRSSSP